MTVRRPVATLWSWPMKLVSPYLCILVINKSWNVNNTQLCKYKSNFAKSIVKRKKNFNLFEFTQLLFILMVICFFIVINKDTKWLVLFKIISINICNGAKQDQMQDFFFLIFILGIGNVLWYPRRLLVSNLMGPENWRFLVTSKN